MSLNLPSSDCGQHLSGTKDCWGSGLDAQKLEPPEGLL